MANFEGRLGRKAPRGRVVYSGRRAARGPSRVAAVTFALLAVGCGSLLGIDDVAREGGAIEGAGGTGGTVLPGSGGSGGTGGVGPGAGSGGSGGGTGGGGTFGAGGGGGGTQGAGGGGGTGGSGTGGSGTGGDGTFGAGGGGTGGAGGGNDTCPPEPFDENDTIGGATKLLPLGPCFSSETSSVLRRGEADWFRISFDDNDPGCDVTPSASFNAGGGASAEVCLFVRPDSPDQDLALSCPAGFEPSGDAGPEFTGCCATNQTEVAYDLGFFVNASATVLVRVSALAAEPFCVPYKLGYEM
ncbi:MAG TPA: hypothetical protein VFS43_19045 [Polyangiaceae bacterium]|nr:hypothetical protein [Polyangiaceae bacterium]